MFKDEKTEFTQINQTIAKPVKNSSLFNLVETLLQEKHELLKEYKIAKIVKTERQAYLVKFNTEPALNLYYFPYQYVERHLTIDKFYSEETSQKGGRGYSYVHYTEKYQHSGTQQVITVHVYFDREGRYVYSQFKKLPNNFLEIEKDFENKIKNNISESTRILSDLLLEKAKRYAKTKERANRLEEKLGTLRENIFLKNQREEYISTSEDFIKAIAEINRYNDLERDCRDTIIQKILDKLHKNLSNNSKEHKKVLSPVTATKSSISIQSSDKDTTKTQVVQNNTAVIKLNNSLSEEIVTLEQEVDSILASIKNHQTLMQSIETHKRITTLDNKLFAWMCNYEFKFNDSEKKRIKSIEQKIKTFPTATDLFKKCIRDGSLEASKLLFYVAKDQLSLSLYDELITTIVSKEVDNDVLQVRIKIADFLFENSESYRMTIRLLNIHLHTIAEDEDLAASLLIKAALRKNVAAFSMLLRHGYNPNSTALIINKIHLPALHSMLILYPDIEYIVLLLQHEAQVVYNGNLLPHKSIFFPKTVIPNTEKAEQMIKKALTQKSQPKSITERIDIFSPNITRDDILSQTCSLKAACARLLHPLIPILAKASKIENIAIAISIFINIDLHIMIECLPASISPGVICILDYKKGKNILQVLQTRKNRHGLPPLPTLKFLIFGGHSADQKILKTIKALCEILQEKCKAQISQIDKTLQKLEDSNIKIIDPNDKEGLKIYYFAYLFLMAQKSKLDIQETQKMMQITSRLGMLFYTSTNKIKQINESLMPFRWTTKIAKDSPFAKQLCTTPIFTFAIKKLTNTEHAYHENTPLLSRENILTQYKHHLMTQYEHHQMTYRNSIDTSKPQSRTTAAEMKLNKLLSSRPRSSSL